MMKKYLEGKKGVAYKLSSSYYYDDFIKKRFLHMVFYGFHDFITLSLSENIKICIIKVNHQAFFKKNLQEKTSRWYED